MVIPILLNIFISIWIFSLVIKIVFWQMCVAYPLNLIFVISTWSYTSKKELHFFNFKYIKAIKNIFRRVNLSDNICTLSLPFQLLPLQVWVLHGILHNVVTPHKGHAEEITHLDVGLLDCLLGKLKVNARYIILKNMLRTPRLLNILLPSGGVITRILKTFLGRIWWTYFLAYKKLGDDAIFNLDFVWKNGKWVKDTSIKNRYTLEDHHMSNDVLPFNRLLTRFQILLTISSLAVYLQSQCTHL